MHGLMREGWLCQLSTLPISLVELAEKFDLESIGEGVEIEEQAESLRQFGCDYFQGYLYGKPAEPVDVPELCGWIQIDDIRHAAQDELLVH